MNFSIHTNGSIFRTIHLPLQKLRQEFRTVLGNAMMVTQAEDEPEPIKA